MKIISAADLATALEYGPLIDRIDETFREGCAVPVRHHHTIPVTGEADATLLLMPAWRDGRFVGVKVGHRLPRQRGRAVCPPSRPRICCSTAPRGCSRRFSTAAS